MLHRHWLLLTILADMLPARERTGVSAVRDPSFGG
jgi:hypothetical protein